MLRCFKRHPGEGTLDCLLGDYCGNIESSYHDFFFLCLYCSSNRTGLMDNPL